MAIRVPAEVYPPGEFIKEELEARGWTQADLAEIIDRTPTAVNEIISAKRGISPETAKRLGDAFGTSAQYWLNLEAAYQLSRTRDQGNGVARRARLYTKFPVRDMVRRNWIAPSENLDVLEQRLLDFFGIKSVDDDPVFLPHAARKATSYEDITPAQRAWLFRAKRLAQAVSISNTFSQERLRAAIERLRGLTHSVEETRHVPRSLADAGIRFLVVEPLPQTRVDGACFWLDARSPVVVLSLRFDRIDAFWHTLMHELGHLKNKDGMSNITLDTDLVGEQARPEDEQPEFEKEADRFAAETLIPQAALASFVTRVRPLYSKLKIVQFANRMQVHPGVVVGQLQHRHEIDWSHSREMLARVRQVITESALTDGWGSTLPAGL